MLAPEIRSAAELVYTVGVSLVLCGILVVLWLDHRRGGGGRG